MIKKSIKFFKHSLIISCLQLSLHASTPIPRVDYALDTQMIPVGQTSAVNIIATNNSGSPLADFYLNVPTALNMASSAVVKNSSGTSITPVDQKGVVPYSVTSATQASSAYKTLQAQLAVGASTDITLQITPSTLGTVEFSNTSASYRISGQPTVYPKLPWNVATSLIVPPSTIISFGDSLVDQGNRTAPGQPAWLPQQRLIAFLAQDLSLAQSQASLFGGNNYAQGGANSGSQYDDTLHTAFGLQDQIAKYALACNGKADPNALYYVGCGANDYGPLDSGQIAPRDFILFNAIAYLSTAVKKLQDMGAKHIVVTNEVPSSPASTSSTDIAQWVQDHQQLTTSMYNLNLQRKGLSTNYVPVRIFDFAKAYTAIQSNPAQYGFIEAVKDGAQYPTQCLDVNTSSDSIFQLIAAQKAGVPASTPVAWFVKGGHPTPAGYKVLEYFFLLPSLYPTHP